MTRCYALVDRDGTINEERHHLREPDQLALIPGAADALIRLRDELDMGIVVLTNQAEVGRGNLALEDLERIHARLRSLLADAGATVDAIEVCPHHPEGSAVAYAFACTCRKPGRGLLDMALAEHAIDLPRSVFIGDGVRDLFPDAGPVRARILLKSGHPLPADAQADHIAKDLGQAVDWLLAQR